MKNNSKLEPIIAFTVLGALAIYVLMVYDSWQPHAEFPTSWRSGVIEALLIFAHKLGFGRLLGKGLLIFILGCCIRAIYLTLKSKA